ncbi:MAG: ATP-binding cassette domain-containing protein [bacterium]|nr:ATP-binding cassette domain-containing protein [bacterium]
MPAPRIEVRDLSKRFGPKVVLDAVTCAFDPGRIGVVIGPSGCGKSTLLRLILGLVRPDAGTILFDGTDLGRAHRGTWESVRSRIGMVFQSAALFDSLTVAENVAFALVERGVREAEALARAREVLSQVGLPDAGPAQPAELSGGMQKRVAIARAIATRPDVLLFDEPTTGLDPVTSRQIEDLIVTLSRETGSTSIVVSHQHSTIHRTADRITLFHHGRILGDGERDLLDTHPAIRSFLDGHTMTVPPREGGAA